MEEGKAKGNKSGPDGRPGPPTAWVSGEGIPLLSACPVSRQDSLVVSESHPSPVPMGPESPGLPLATLYAGQYFVLHGDLHFSMCFPSCRTI